LGVTEHVAVRHYGAPLAKNRRHNDVAHDAAAAGVIPGNISLLPAAAAYIGRFNRTASSKSFDDIVDHSCWAWNTPA
jgi:hypothetical protein